MTERAQASKLAYLPVTSFVQQTASRAPTPGGGAVSALNGSLGAGLLMMVCRLTAGKPRYAAVAETLRAQVDALMPLRDRMRELVDLDAAAFDGVMAAYALPKQSEAEVAARARAVQAAYETATSAPFEVMRLCLEGLERAPGIAETITPNALSDCGVAALALQAGFHGAAYNVRINLPELAEGDLRREVEAALASWPARADQLATEARAIVDRRLVG